MIRREFNSSRTRVTPVFAELLARDPSGVSWLRQLLALPGIASREVPLSIASTHPLTAYGWGTMEKGLRPPRALLAWQVQHAHLLKPIAVKTSAAPPSKRQTERQAKRQAVFNGHSGTIAEALKYLEQPQLPPNEWYIFEGITCPDIYLETSDLLVVIEGKRTERGPTTDSEWMHCRHQMLRHLDCAWEVRGQRAVLGFFIVEGQGGAEALAVPPRWQAAAQATIMPAALDDSLPHRTPAERQAIAAGFLGATTWQQVCVAFQIDYTALMDEHKDKG